MSNTNPFKTVAFSISALSIFALGSFGLMFAPVNTYAITPKENLTNQIQTAKIARCEIITTKIETATARFENNKKRHVEQYQKTVDNTKALISKLESEQPSVDLTALKANLQTLQDKVTKFATDYKAYIDQLNLTKNYACGNSEGEFKAALKEARAKLKIVRADTLDTRNYIQTTLRPEIQKVRDQIK